jgi:predicted metal-dependent enzyme (double-stranded beta helix superfamily)
MLTAAIIIPAMRLVCALISVSIAAGQPQTLPPPFPRPNAVKMLDNDRVQVWSVVWPKGQPTPLHRHIYDITGTYIAPGDRVITDVDGSKRPVTNAAGGIVWQFKGLTHIEEGTSENPLRAVMIELKGNGPSGKTVKPTGVPEFASGGSPLLDNDRVVVWGYPGTAAPVRHAHIRDTVVVWSEGREGRAIFLPAGTEHTPEPISAGAKATIFELK